jgi:XRE family transcriptional regulator, regulator of sulfur utilization
MSDTALNLANNMKQLREARGITQQQVAKIAGIPRPTWANLESGSANPTLQVLVRVAGALSVTVEELIAPPRASAKFYPAATLPIRRRGQVVVRKLLPEVITGLEMERMELPAGALMTGTPHTAGTREYLTCESGQVELTASGQSWLLSPGDVVVFRGDQKHSYKNPTRGPAIAYSMIAIAPAG